jgi:hypothetical protein
MSDTNRTQMAYVEEAAFGEQKSGSFHLQLLRLTSDTLAQQATTTRSGEIRANRRLANVRTTGKSVAGALGFELSYGTFDALFKAALLSAAWGGAATVTASTISAAASDNSFNDSGAGFGSLAAGDWVYASGFTATADNGFFKIVSKTDSKIVVSGGTLTDEASGSSRTIKQGDRIVDGTTLVTHNFERQYADLTTTFALFTGVAFNTLALNVPTEGIITGSFDCIGYEETSISASGGNGYDDITTTDPMQTGDVTALLENQVAAGFVGWTMNLNNNLRLKREAPSGIVGVGTGQADISGTLQIHFESSTMYDKWLDETPSSLALCIVDLAANKYVFDFPQLRFTSGERNVTGPNGDVTANFGWTAYEHATESCQMSVNRWASS